MSEHDGPLDPLTAEDLAALSRDIGRDYTKAMIRGFPWLSLLGLVLAAYLFWAHFT